ncbi:Glycosyl hydrolases family 28 [Musa troglodytarum]|uniref:Glycosyl hydrolases family 28 n=1 Tax=Musa troglodytarum TaxID=320322 RepID=A0A9E7JIF4_9LILI|nr:Glycosyl hydrolases family 28 [Musa troglodytarum]
MEAVCFRYIFLTMEHSPPIFHVLMTLVLWTVVTTAFIGTAEGHRHYRRGGSETELEAFHYAGAGAGGCRAHVASLTDFGGVGDGVTSNTAAFAAAVANLSKVAYDGGAMLVVPAGRWLTGPFSLTSHFTLFLDHDAVILATQDINEWPIIDPLPSYGRGRDSAGGRYSNLIMGYNLTDVVITDSSSNVRIEDCYIVSGDDCIAIKSGWDEYGIAFNMPSKHIVIRRLTCISPTSAVIALGSEMSGGIQDVRAEDITAINSESGVRIKTTVGRGAYVKDIFVRGMNLYTMKWVFWMTGTYGQHPDDNFDPKAIPVVQNISYSNVVAENVTMAAKLEGIPGAPFTGICIYNVTAEVVKSKKPIWNCTDVEGVSSHVTPTPCAQIPESPDRITHCPFPEDDLPVLMTLVLWTVVTTAFIGTAEGHRHYRRGGSETELEAFHYAAAGAGGCRAHVASLTDFGGVGDGVTSNTAAFAAAVANLSKVAYDGGAMLVVPAGRWLTGAFRLTRHFTLFLDHDAVILATQDINEWPIIDPLPSYGRGRDSAGGRYSNLIMGYNLTDVVITGNNGTIDGQGETWWKMFRNKELNYTRGFLIELMYSIQVLISNITLVNSPSWNVHPVYSSHVIVSGITILAPVNSPNTDGINPDSSSNVRIEDCYIVSGDDCIAIKSGWDEYGIAFNMPSKHIVIRRLTCISPTSAVIALGSEMSGGIQDVRAEDITAINSESGVRIKTTIGRGAYVKDIFVRRMNLHTMKWVFWMTGTYGQHPDNNFDPKAIPVVQNISYSNVVAENVTMAAKLEGIPGAPFTGICIYNVTAEVVKSKKPIWNCTDVEGVSSHVTPTPCAQIPESPDRITHCPFPEDDLPVDCVGLEECSFRRTKP